MLLCGKGKHELRVTSSNPGVRRLKPRVGRLKVRVARFKAQVKRLKAQVGAIKPRVVNMRVKPISIFIEFHELQKFLISLLNEF